MTTRDARRGSLRPSAQKGKIVQRRSAYEQQQDTSEKRLKILTDHIYGLFKGPADEGGCSTTILEDKNWSPQFAPRAQELDVYNFVTEDKSIRPPRNATVYVTEARSQQ